MSGPSSIRHRFNAGNTRRARLRTGPAAMMTGIVVLAHAALSGNAIAATEYAVDGLAVGTQLNLGSKSYREYKCNPSDQFAGLIWCQKTRSEKERRGSYIEAYSLLHSKNGNLSYINRSQEPAFLNPSEAELDIQRYSRKLDESARILKIAQRSGLPDGVISVWGKITSQSEILFGGFFPSAKVLMLAWSSGSSVGGQFRSERTRDSPIGRSRRIGICPAS